jgi:hypothetical protein
MHSVASQRFGSMIKYWKQNNFNIVVITATEKETYMQDGVYYYHDPLLKKDRYQIVRKIFARINRLVSKIPGYNQWWFNNVMHNIDNIIIEKSIEKVIATFPPIETLSIAHYIYENYSIPIISDFRDGLCFEPLERDLEFKILKNRLHTIESAIVKASSHVVSVSPLITDYFKTKYKKEKAVTITNGFDINDLKNIEAMPFSTNKLNIVYTGKLEKSSKGQNIDLLLKIFDQNDILKSKIMLHMFGNYTSKEMRKFSNYENIKIHPMVDRNTALSAQKGADILLLVATSDRKSVVTGKIFEYLFAPAKIICISNGAAAEKIIKDSNSGFLGGVDNVDKLIEFLYALIEERISFKKENPNVSEFLYEDIAKKYREIL